MRKRSILALGTGLVLSGASALAQIPPLPPVVERRIDNIGNRGQLVFGVDRITGVAVEKLSETLGVSDASAEARTSIIDVAVFGAGAETTALLPRLALDYFLLDGASIGIAAMVARASGDSEFKVRQGSAESELPATPPPTHWFALVQPRVGYAQPFNQTLGLWARLGFGYSYRWYESGRGTDDYARVSVDHFSLLLDAMLVISPMQHFALLVGPFVDLGLGGSAKYVTNNPPVEVESSLTSFGLSWSLVGYHP